MSQNGKGDKRRPKSVDYKTWSKNYESIFRKKKNNGKTNKKQIQQNAIWGLFWFGRLAKYRRYFGKTNIRCWCIFDWKFVVLDLFIVGYYFAT